LASEDGLKQFFSEASSLKLLTAAQEIELAKRIERGDRSARRELCAHNVRLAIKWAKAYRNMGVEFEDLVQEGMIGLQIAVDKFDWRREIKFSTYASHWIKRELDRAVRNKRAVVKVPRHVLRLQRQAMMYLAANPEATDDEVCTKLECSPAQLAVALDAPQVGSLDESRGDNETTLQSVLPDKTALGDDPALLVEDLLTQFQLGDLRSALMRLSPQQRRVVRLRWGLDGPPRSYREIEIRLKMSKQEVQREIRESLKILRKEMRT